MSKHRIQNYVFSPGVGSDSNAYPNAYGLLLGNKLFIQKEAVAYIAATIASDNATNLNPNAVTLLTNNKAFLQDELNAWIAAQVASNTPPFVGFTYNAPKCRRDVGFVIDAYIADIRYGGNESIIQVAKQYWLSGVPQIDGDRTPEVAAHTRLRDIINNNILPRVAYASQQSPVTSTQNLTGTSAESGVSSSITVLSGILTNVIANGLSVIPTTNFSVRTFANYIYDTAKCERDIGYVVDAYLNDLRYGGNVKTRFVASRYWNGSIPQIDGDRKPEIVTHQFIADLIINVVFTQIGYGVQLQNQVPRYTSGQFTAEIQANGRISTLSAIIVDVITNGLVDMPLLENGVSTIKVQGRYRLDELLLITNTTNNQVIYNFSDPAVGATINLDTAANTNGNPGDEDFPAFLQTADYVTTITLKADTSTSARTDDIQIFVEAGESRTRPYEFGTDAIERMRVAQPQSMLDADFEYGLQPTKWQAIGISRGYPSVYEVPGTDTPVVSVITDASAGTGGVGQSLITVTTSGPHGFAVGDPITIKALSNSISGFSRAEGTFIIATVPTSTTFAYYAVARVGTSNGQVLASTYTQLRKGAFYTGASIGAPAFSVFSNGVTGSFFTQFNTDQGSDQLAFTGTVPVIGAPVSGTGISTGTQITGVVGGGGLVVTAALAQGAPAGATTIVVENTTGILEGLAVNNGTGTSVFVTGINNSVVSLTGPLTVEKRGSNATYTNVTGANLTGSGINAQFSVARVSGAYSTLTVTTPGTGYQVGNRLRVLGTALGGATPANDMVIICNTVNPSTGAILLASIFTGTSVNGNADYFDLSPDLYSNFNGDTATFDISRTNGAYFVALNTSGLGFNVNDTMTVLGTQLGGATPANDAVITVTSTGTTYVDGISSYDTLGTAPSGDGTQSFTYNPPSLPQTPVDLSIAWTGGSYSVIITFPGSGYTISDTFTIPGTQFGGLSPDNDLTLTVTGVSTRSTIGTVTITGTGFYNTTFTGLTVTNESPQGTAGSFNIVRTGGGYTIAVNQTGTGYLTGDKISISGTQLGGLTPTNDAVVSVLDASGGINSVSITGVGSGAESIEFYSAVSLSDITSAPISNGASIAVSAIAVIQITFATAHGLIPGSNLLTTISTTGTNHSLAAGPFYVESTPTANTIRYTARAAGVIDATTLLAGIVYSRPDSYFVHRPYDGGVQLGTGGPQHGGQAIRQSKKYVRYQSGKGIMYTTGALFAPSYNLQNLEATGTAVGSFITVTTDDVDHGCQVGGRIRIIGVDTPGYNGSYTITDVITERSFRVQAQTVLGNVYATLSTTAQMSVAGWHGAVVRAGTFDDQNGMFWQYDGRTLAVGRRSSTFQLAGFADVTRDSNLITGVNTRFRDQLNAGDRIVIKGMTHVVSSVISNTSLTVTPDYRGTTNATQVKLCLVKDFIVPQSHFNMDRVDGTGPSGYNVDYTKMQMIGIQWSWYGAGFIDYMLRGSDGDFIFVHRIRNSNVNTEAYMRTGNMPVRYEVLNESAEGKLANSISASQTTLSLVDASNFPNESGVVYVDNELIAFSGKSGNTLTGCTRAAPMTNFLGGAQRTFRAGVAATHEFNTGVILVSNTISPIISHWGSAIITDGRFDEDRGYIFNYAATNISVSTTRQTAFLIRLAPSVSNAIVGDLGDRELLNRAQLLLKGIEITSDTGTGGIVVEGVLNPQNYPTNPSAIAWSGLQGSSQGGQPSFAQIAPGGSVQWSTGATQTNTPSTTLAFPTGTITATTGYWGSGRSIENNQNFFVITSSDYATYLAGGLAVGDAISGTGLQSGTTITQLFQWFSNFVYVGLSRNTNAAVTGPGSLTVSRSYPLVNTSQVFFQRASWESVGATAGTEVSDTLFPANTRVTTATLVTYFSTQYYRVTFSQTSSSTPINAGTTTITFRFGQPPFALPGETIFSFISAPGTSNSLDLSELKELTASTLGGRGAFPNGPDVLAINVYKASGTAIPSNIILRWGEAQA